MGCLVGGVLLAPPFLLCSLTPALSPEGIGGAFIASDGFSWCFGLRERGRAGRRPAPTNFPSTLGLLLSRE